MDALEGYAATFKKEACERKVGKHVIHHRLRYHFSRYVWNALMPIPLLHCNEFSDLFKYWFIVHRAPHSCAPNFSFLHSSR